MISNYEFIKTQAFELSWAIFRCTELFTQDKLRKEIESAAVELIADSNIAMDALEGESPRIEKLIALIRLAESVGQIAAVNANVLYRELGNLGKAIQLEVTERRDKKNIAVSLDSMFTNSAYASQLGDLATSQLGQSTQSNPARDTSAKAAQPIRQAQGESASANEGEQRSVNATAQSTGSQFGSIEQLLSAATRSSQTIGGGDTSAKASQPVRQAQGEPASVNANPLSQFIQPAVVDASQPVRQAAPVAASPAVVAQATVATVAPTRPAQVVSAGSWQSVILQKVKDLGQTTTKELTINFPEISERTIRFYLQKLVDNGSIDRIGSTGPGAAYRAKV